MKRVLLVAGDRATAFEFQRGELLESWIFAADDQGRAHFRRYLTARPRTPLYVLVDVVEEEYRQETMPHVRGGDRKSVVKRKQQRLFRGTEFCHAMVTGREKDGRRDDRALFTALTRPEVLTPWLALCRECEVPVPGVLSLPLMSPLLLKRLGATGRNTLLVSLQSSNGLRQSFFRDQKLMVSRLAPMPRLGTVPFASHLMGELDKLRRYLNSLSLTRPDHPLDIYLLSHGDYLDELAGRCRDSETERFFIIDVTDAARRLKIRQPLSTPYSDALFAAALVARPPADHYARPGDLHFHRLAQTRRSLVSAGLGALTLSAILSGVNFIDGLAFDRQIEATRAKTNFYEARFQAAREGLPQTPVAPQDIHSAVVAAEQLAHYRASPLPLLRAVGAVLATMPDVRLDTIDWATAASPVARVGDGAQPQPDSVDRTGLANYPLFELAQLSGELTPFDGNYRFAVERVRALAAQLEAQAEVLRVTVTEFPIEIASDRAMAATTEELDRRGKARFTLRVIRGREAPDNG